ncbi:acyl-CoA N-acyltransferase [Rhodotorula sp. JG-1b]|nr:acyl-CoA N-acyltransferase [Rhodotorula sp. JG-1b]
MSGRAHLAVKARAEALADKLRTAYKDAKGKGRQVHVPWRQETAVIDVYRNAQLSEEEREGIWALFETNMRSLYERSAEGYDPEEKRAELFHPEARFLLLRRAGDQASEPPLGYCIFRFDTEETEADEGEDDLCDVAYCYELQIESSHQKQGVGRVLMDALERLARAYKMDKTMLTAFKNNTDAIAFYRRIGFATDEVDPSEYGIDDVDYIILSKLCN